MLLLVRMLANIKNSQNIYSLQTTCLKNNLCRNVLNKLEILGFIRGYSELDNKFIIFLKYYKSSMSISRISLISKPGRIVFFSYLNLLKLKDYKFRVVLISTNLGILTLEEALKFQIGGNLLFFLE